MSIRQRLITEISKSRENFNNIIDGLYESKDTKSINMVKKVIDELELFSSDIDFSESSYNGDRLSLKNKIDKKLVDKLNNFNNLVMDDLKNISKASNKISDLMIDNDDLDISREMKKIRHYITNARYQYKDRIEFIKEMI